MSQPKLLSITIPTWNRAQLLAEQLTLLVGQIMEYQFSEKIEIVIADNGSDDNTMEVVEKFKNSHDFIIYHNNGVNKGARFNLIKALELASGKYSIFLGDDDRYKSDGLKKMLDCLDQNENVDAVFDSFLFKRNPFKDKSFISLENLLQHFYYNIGNAGLFIINTSLIQANIKKYGYNYFSLSWPQTQLLILSLSVKGNCRILLQPLDLFAESIHDKVMMYNSYYLLRGLYFDLADAIDSIKTEIPDDCYNAARQYLKNNILQNTFNILQCGVFVDDKAQRAKTVSYIKSHIFKYSKKEKVFLNLVVFALILPSAVSKGLSDIFIFATRGKKGLEKKNNFVKQELSKIISKKNNDKSVRTFDFNS